jgi:PPM family protein phosphatase
MTQKTPVWKTSILPSVAAPRRSLQATSLAVDPFFEAVGICDTGVARKDNQDAFQLRVEAIGPGREILAAVADGMGGLTQGRFASRLALQIFCEAFQRGSAQPSPKTMRRAMEEANQALSQAGQKLRLPRMGTTLTAVCLEGRRISLAHIGDSRAYRIRSGAVELLTTDHSRAGELARMRLIPPAAVRTHDQRSILTRALGMDLMVQPEISRGDAEAGDVFLLCSDGVWSALDDSALPALLAGAATLTEFARSVVECALEDGSDDNVCAVVLRAGERPAEEAPAPAGRLGRLWARFRA